MLMIVGAGGGVVSLMTTVPGAQLTTCPLACWRSSRRRPTAYSPEGTLVTSQL